MMKNIYGLLIAGILLIVSSLEAQYSIEWIGAKNELWEEPDNWSEGRVPNDSDLVLIDTGDTVIVKAFHPIINSLDLIQSGLVISAGSELTIEECIGVACDLSGAYLKNQGRLRIFGTQGDALANRNGSELLNQGEIIILEVTNEGIRNLSKLINNGSLVIEDSRYRGIYNTDSLINNGDIIIRDFSNSTDPTQFGDAGIFNGGSGHFINTGNIELKSGEDNIYGIDNRANLYNRGSLSIAQAFEAFTNRDSLFNSGEIVCNGGRLLSSGFATNDTGGLIRILRSGIVVSNGGGFENRSTMVIDSSSNSAMTLSNGGSFDNYDSIYMERVRVNGISIGLGINTFTNRSGGTIEMRKIGILGVSTIADGVFENDGTLNISNVGNIGIKNDGITRNRGDITIDSSGLIGITNRGDFVTFITSSISISNSPIGLENYEVFVHGGDMTLFDYSEMGLLNNDRFIITGSSLSPSLINGSLRIIQNNATPFESTIGSLFEVGGDFLIE